MKSFRRLRCLLLAAIFSGVIPSVHAATGETRAPSLNSLLQVSLQSAVDASLIRVAQEFNAHHADPEQMLKLYRESQLPSKDENAFRAMISGASGLQAARAVYNGHRLKLRTGSHQITVDTADYLAHKIRVDGEAYTWSREHSFLENLKGYREFLTQLLGKRTPGHAQWMNSLVASAYADGQSSSSMEFQLLFESGAYFSFSVNQGPKDKMMAELVVAINASVEKCKNSGKNESALLSELVKFKPIATDSGATSGAEAAQPPQDGVAKTLQTFTKCEDLSEWVAPEACKDNKMKNAIELLKECANTVKRPGQVASAMNGRAPAEDVVEVPGDSPASGSGAGGSATAPAGDPGKPTDPSRIKGAPVTVGK